MSIVVSVTADIYPFAEDPEAPARGIAYASIPFTLLSVLLWTMGYNYLRPRSTDGQHAPQTNEPSESLRISMDMGASWNDEAHDNPQPQQQRNDEKKIGKAKSMLLELKKVAKEVVTPATIALMSSLLVGVLPPVRVLFIGSGAPLKFVIDISKMLGQPAIPIMLLILGASLSNGPKSGLISNLHFFTN